MIPMSKNEESREVVHLNIKQHSLQTINGACYNPIIAKNLPIKERKHVH